MEPWFTDAARVAVDLGRDLALAIDRIDNALAEVGRGAQTPRKREVARILQRARDDAHLTLSTTYGLPWCSECGHVGTHRGTCSRSLMNGGLSATAPTPAASPPRSG